MKLIALVQASRHHIKQVTLCKLHQELRIGRSLPNFINSNSNIQMLQLEEIPRHLMEIRLQLPMEYHLRICIVGQIMAVFSTVLSLTAIGMQVEESQLESL
jgi:hypothetical protein